MGLECEPDPPYFNLTLEKKINIKKILIHLVGISLNKKNMEFLLLNPIGCMV
jgi:hypothetical protein